MIIDLTRHHSQPKKKGCLKSGVSSTQKVEKAMKPRNEVIQEGQKNVKTR